MGLPSRIQRSDGLMGHDALNRPAETQELAFLHNLPEDKEEARNGHRGPSR
jgi:hypothetical protein